MDLRVLKVKEDRSLDRAITVVECNKLRIKNLPSLLHKEVSIAIKSNLPRDMLCLYKGNANQEQGLKIEMK